MKDTIVLFPIPAVGHFIPMVELAKLLLHHNFSVNVLVLSLPTASPATSRIIAANPSITFHYLPPISSSLTSSSSSVAHLFDILRLAKPHLLTFLASLTVRALVLDFLCSEALTVASSLNLPAYFFISTSASNLAVFLHLPVSYPTLANIKDFGDTPLYFPGLPPVHHVDLPDMVHEQDEAAYRDVLTHFQRFPLADGIIVNTFTLLEQRALTAISDGLCHPDHTVPPVYCVGPLIKEAAGDGEGGNHQSESLTWLDAQPRKSVVFLCFGSLGTFSAEQLKEIAAGLERSGQRFLWVVRAPLPPSQRFGPPLEPDLDELLPEGFVQRTQGRGLVVKLWAPQASVLGHQAVGGFVTHCGWNSVLEAMTMGVPMIAWPLYAEQRMNKVFLVEEKGLAVEMKGYDGAVVAAEEVEERVRWLMQEEGGRELRERAEAAKKAAMAALGDGGSSEVALMEFVAALKRGKE